MDYQFLSADAIDLCQRLLHKDPMQRIGSSEQDALEIKSHPWFSCINWEHINAKTIAPPYCPQLDQDSDTKHFPSEFTTMQLSPNDRENLLATAS